MSLIHPYDMRWLMLLTLLYAGMVTAQKPADLYGEGVRAYYAQDYQTALQKYTQAIALKPRAEVYLYSRGTTYLRLDKDSMAAIDFKKVLSIDSIYIDAWYELGIINVTAKKYDSAFAYFSHALRINGNDVRSLHQLGLLWYYKRENGQAIEVYNKILQIDSTDDQAYYKRGLAEFNMEEYEDAANDFSMTYRLDASNTLALEQRAITFMRLNDLERACLDWTLLLRRNNPRAKDNIAKYCSKE